MSKIALIVLDTLRKDAFDRHFDWVPGTRFENAWSTSNWTVPAHASLFTGQYASDVGTYSRSNHLDCNESVMAELLSGAGYRTRAFSANPYLSPYFDFDRGFDDIFCHRTDSAVNSDVIDWREHVDGPSHLVPLLAARASLRTLGSEYDTRDSLLKVYNYVARRYPILPDLVEPDASAALSYVRERSFGDREFLFLNLMDVHTPYNPPRSYRSRRYSREDFTIDSMNTVTDDAPDPIPKWDAYNDCAAYLSETLEKIYRQLDDFDYVITLSDHGEAFGEGSIWGHAFSLRPEITRIPLVINGLERDSSVAETPVNLNDVFATVMDLAGIPNRGKGQSLRDDLAERPRLVEYHGVQQSGRIDELREFGLSNATIKEYDDPRYGIALAPDYYGYESIDGFESTGRAAEDDPHEVLTALKRNRAEIKRPGVALDDDVKAELEQWGYL